MNKTSTVEQIKAEAAAMESTLKRVLKITTTNKELVGQCIALQYSMPVLESGEKDEIITN